jgi:hypothetical protein
MRPSSLAGRSNALRRAPLLVAFLAGCRSWRAEPLPAAGAPARAVGGHLRVTRADGARVELTRTRIAGDSLRGERRTPDGGDAARTVVTIPLDSVYRLERRRVSIGRTVGLYFGVMGAIFLVMSAAEAEAYGPSSR